jgi:cytochrome b
MSTLDMAGETAPTHRQGWDPLVRITHWAIAAAVLINGAFLREGSPVHVWIGYAAFAILLLRLLWGVIGAREARFSAFPPSIPAAMRHVGDLIAGRHRSYPSHNPLGSLMVYALWGLLLVVSVTGIAMAGSPLAERERHAATAQETVLMLASYDDDGDEAEEGEGKGYGEMLEEIHEVAANLMLLLAALHVAGVAIESRISRVNLVRAMVTGWPNPRPGSRPDRG